MQSETPGATQVPVSWSLKVFSLLRVLGLETKLSWILSSQVSIRSSTKSGTELTVSVLEIGTLHIEFNLSDAEGFHVLEEGNLATGVDGHEPDESLAVLSYGPDFKFCLQGPPTFRGDMYTVKRGRRY